MLPRGNIITVSACRARVFSTDRGGNRGVLHFIIQERIFVRNVGSSPAATRLSSLMRVWQHKVEQSVHVLMPRIEETVNYFVHSPFHGHGIADIISPSSSWLQEEFRTFPLLQVMPSTLCLAHPLHSHALVSPLHLHLLLLGRLLPLLPLLHVPLCCPHTTLVLVVGVWWPGTQGQTRYQSLRFPVRPKTDL